MSLDDLYREVIMDHYRAPRNHGVLEKPALSVTLTNPLCGDEITLHLQVDNDAVTDAKFSGHGCSISQASASLMTQAIMGKSVAEAIALMQQFRGMMRGAVPADEEAMGDLVALSGVTKFPVRVKCAVLPWEALRQTLAPNSQP